MDTMDINGEVFHVELFYPRHSPCSAIEIDLMDVRAADGLLITYDFERDGWSIKQAQRFKWHVDDDLCDPLWKEVAFVQAWGSQEEVTPQTRPELFAKTNHSQDDQ